MVRYSHWLIRQVGYEAMLTTIRRELHARVAAVLESGLGLHAMDEDSLRRTVATVEVPDSAVGSQGGALARHWLAADRPWRGGLWGLASAREDLRRSRFDACERASREARELLRACGDRVGEACAAATWADAVMTAGRYDDAATAVERATEALEAQADPESLRVAAQALSLASEVQWRQGRFDVCMSLVRRALTRARRSGAHRTEGRCMMRIGSVLGATGRTSEGKAYFERALARFRAAGDRADEARALGFVAGALLESGELDRSVALFSDALAASRAANNPGGEAGMLYGIGFAHFERGDWPAAAAAIEASLSIRRGIGDVRGVVWCVLVRGAASLDAGRTDDALLDLEEGAREAKRMRVPDAECWALAKLARCLWARGDREGSRGAAEKSARVASGMGYREGERLAALAIAVCDGDAGAALAAGRAASAQGTPHVAAEAFATAAEILRRAGDPAGAASAASQAAEISRRHGMNALLLRAEAAVA